MASIVSTLAAGFNLLSLKYLREMVNASQEDKGFYLIAVVALVFLSGIISLATGRYITRFFEAKLASHREEIAGRILKARFEKVIDKIERLVPVLLFEINTVGGFGKVIPEFIVALLQILVIFSYLIFLSWKLSVIVLGLILLAVVFSLFLFPAVRKVENRISKTRYSLHVSLDVMKKGFKDLMMSTSHGDSYLANSVRPSNQEIASLNTQEYTVKTVGELVMNMLIIIGFGVSMLLYSQWVKLPQETLIQYMALILFILPSLVKVIIFFNQVIKVENSINQINAFDLEIQEIANKEESGTILSAVKGEVLLSLDKVQYQYNVNRDGFKLGPITLDINENEVTLINGGNGSGKTTLFMILSGLFTPLHGSVKYFGNKLTTSNVQSFRDTISCYFSDSPVFDNLSYTQLPKMGERGREIISDLGLEGKTDLTATAIANTHLSFGQRGRLNLMRMLLEDREIFMFDEWAANQDIHFKEKFYHQIIPSLKEQGKTVILISHDDKFYHLADKIVTLDGGNLHRIITN